MAVPYPPIEPYRSQRIKVSSLHEIYVEECGNPMGKPAIFIHGGPGGGSEPWHRQFFDPARYRIVLFDQRGCGRSTPHAELRENTTWDLVADIERIRGLLAVDRWLVFGGSWGSTLALTYAQMHPECVAALVVRGIFLLRRKEIEWFYQDGCNWIYPDAWEAYRDAVPEGERADILAAYYRRLTSTDAGARRGAAQAWSRWEGSTCKLIQNAELVERFGNDRFAEAFARIECHYFINHGFFPRDGWVLDNVWRIRHIPGVIVHGRYDVVCPLRSAWDLHRAWPEAEFYVIDDAGHAASESGTLSCLIGATDRLADRI